MDLTTRTLQPSSNSRFLGVEKATAIYTLLTAVFVLLLWPRLGNPGQMLGMRVLVMTALAAIYALYLRWPCRPLLVLRTLFPLSLLSVWYPETYEFCSIFPYLDHIFAGMDQALFGFQPALVFHKVCPELWWSELFHLGYFSYYPLILVTVLAAFWWKKKDFGRIAFIILASFFLYYLIYLFLPVAGPQYYFCATGGEQTATEVFPEVGHYFRTHTDMLPSPGSDGLFRTLVEQAQEQGERPTAAFPSSHVGIGTILMILLFRIHRKTAFIFFPLYLLLVGATIYIEAHYFVDVIGGLLTAVVFFWFTNWIYPRTEHFDWESSLARRT